MAATHEDDSLTSRTAPRLYGHGEGIETLLSAWRERRMPHAWILSGPRGIGKATLAYHVARMVLAGEDSLDMSPENPVFRRVAASSHTDMLVVEPAYDEKKEEAKPDITVEEAREIAGFLSKTPAESAWRVVIVDTADALNVNAANAILKIVEEPPPQALLLLVSHNPGRLLPTIRSRCRLLRLTPPGAADFDAILREHAPQLSSTDIDTLAALSRSAPGTALEFAREEGLSCYRQLLACCASLPQLPLAELRALAERYLSDHTHTRWQILSQLLLQLIARAADGQPFRGTAEEEGALRAMRALQPPQAWARLHAELAAQFAMAARLHLDYKTVLLDAFSRLTLARAA